MEKTILVTGGLGYIGSHTVLTLINAGYKPIIVDNLCNSQPWILTQLEKLSGQKIKNHAIDCTNLSDLEAVFKNEPIHGVIHFAALKAVNESVLEPLFYYNNNVKSLLNIIELVSKYKVRKLVFSSSCTVYGTADKLPISEDHPIKTAESPYGSTKQMCERIINDCLKAKKIENAVILRYFNPIGAHSSGLIGELPLGVPNNLAPYIMQTAAGIRSALTIYGNNYNTHDGTCIRDYIHVMDLAEAHVKSIEVMEISATSHTLNIGTGKGNSVLDVINAFENATGIKLNYTYGERRIGDIEKIYADTNLSEKILKWKSKHSLEEAMRDSWKWQMYLKSK